MASSMHCFVVLVTVWSSPWLIEGADDFYSAATLKKIAEIDVMVNDTVDPCDDFERYTCNNIKIDYSEQITAETDALLKNRIFSGKRETDVDAVKKLIDFYQQCTVAFGKRNKSVQNMVDDLGSIFKNAFDTFQNFDATMIAKLSAYLAVYHDYAFMIGIAYSKFNSTRFPKHETFLVFYEPELSQQRGMYDPKNISSNADIIRKGLNEAYAILEPNKTKAEVNATVSELFDFEVEISKLFTFNVSDPEADALELTVGEAMEQLPGIDWRTFVTLLSNYSDFDFLNGTELENYPLKIVYPNVWKALSNVLDNTPDEVIREYIRVRLVNTVSSLSLKTDEENDCFSMVKEAFPIVYQYLYITERLPTDADRKKVKSSVSKIADNIISQVKIMMEKVSWMRNDTETYAGFTDKMNKLTKTIAYPDYFVNETWLNDHYKTISISKSDTLYNLFLITKKVHLRNALESNLDILPRQQITNPNPYMDQQADKFVILLGFLHDIFYNLDYIPVLNYGALGTVVGHEVIHGYDTTGVNFDGDGEFHPWMSNKSRQSFDEMADCVIDEYNNFTLTDSNGTVWHINGTITSGEDIADIAGIRAAYNAWKSDPVNVQPFPRTKKLKDFTQEQLFFVSFARNFCSPPIADKDFKETFEDEHPPDQVRIFGTLRNFAPFREAFKCPVGSKYAPEKFCEVYAPS